MPRTPVNLFLNEQANGVRRTEPSDAVEPEGGLIDAVQPGSIAAEAGIEAGARVIAANGRVLRDVIDFQFYTAEPRVDLLVRQADGAEQTYHLEKFPDDDLGLEFAEATWDGIKICTNTCFFCFLKGLPKAMRRTLYLKDDDYRLSFLHGNFVTLTNLGEQDWQRLHEQRLSPLNVSVHATETGLRREMLGYGDAPDVVEQLRRLGSLRIEAHTQIVLCPGVNDGAHLDRTISDLGALYPTVQTISIVPVGATMQFEQRMGVVGKAIDETRACSPAYARAIVRQVSGWQRRFRAEHGASIVQAADEFLLIGGSRIPAAGRYDGFPQYENGIGMTRALLDDWHATRRRLRHALTRDGRSPFAGPAAALRLTVACGALIAPQLARLFAEFAAESGVAAEVIGVRNVHFGARINVSGLLTARDFIEALSARPLGDVVLLPRTSLDYFGRKFLDDGTPAGIERALGRPVLFASGMSEAIEQLLAFATGSDRVAPARPAASNGMMWAAGVD